MKKIALSILLTLHFTANLCFAAGTTVYNEAGKFGLKNANNDIITKAQYKKLIRINDRAFIALKGSKYGFIDEDGNVLLDYKYSHASRILDKFVRFRNYKGYGLYDCTGRAIIPQEQESIELLFGGMFLISKNYKYGVTDFDGNILIDCICDDIYMPKPNIMRVKYNGEWYEIEQIKSTSLTLPPDIEEIKADNDFKITKLVTSPGAASKYSIVAATDYSLKLISSISPAYEETIDELMLSQGAEAVSIFIKVAWLPKFPIVYAKHYYKIFRNPNNGPLADIKNNVKRELE